ncbi:MAG: hypothetical protein ACPGYY_04095 [Bacteroidia bacterium]
MRKTLLILSIFTLGVLLQSCGGDEDGGTTPSKTVDRSQLTDKLWYYNGEEWGYFDSDGTYNDDETWRWFPTGDSLEITSTSLGVYTMYFDYIEADEMKAGHSIDLTTIYTTTP